MKQLSLLFTICLSLSLSAQNIILIEPDFIEAHHDNLDLSNEWLDVIHNLHYSNLTDDSIYIYWQYEKVGECPEEWFYIASDNYNHYTNGVNSNYYPQFNVDVPVLSPPMDTMGYFEMWIQPKGVPGCCEFVVNFWEASNPDSIIGTAVFDYRLNNPECAIINTEEALFEEVKLYPNPANEYCTLQFPDSDFSAASVKLFNVFGQVYENRFIQNVETNFDISNLPAGLYYFLIGNQRVIKFLKE